MRHQVGKNRYYNPRGSNMLTSGVIISQNLKEGRGNIKKEQPCGCEEAMKKCLNRDTDNDTFCCDFDETSIYEYDCECLQQKKSCF